MRCASGSRPNKPVRPADEPTEAPLADDELDALFAPLADARLIALAVSGGADSLALLDAIGRWRKHGPPVLVLTVDHRLRKGSRAEANGVAAIAKRRGMEARVLSWKGARPESDIENAAVALQDGPGVFAVVAIAVVEGQRDEAPAIAAARQPAVNLVERHQVDVGGAPAA